MKSFSRSVVLCILLVYSGTFLFVPVRLFATSKPNIVLITIDTLRADRLGCYGYRGAETPNLDRLASEGIAFTNAVSHVPLTRPSHTSIFTSLYPYQHGVHDNIAPPLAKNIPTLAEILQSHGYRTAAFVASFVVNSQSGLQRGFQTYADRFDPAKQPTDFALNLEKRGDEVYQEFADWLSLNHQQSYFAWIHLYDPHFPYDPPAPYNARFSDHPYDGEVAYADSIVGKLTKLFSPNTLLIVTSDHGESLGDHGENAHSFFIYDSTLHVPLIFRWPGNFQKGVKISIQARLIDLMPTILESISAPVPPGLRGTSLKPWLLNPTKHDPGLASYCETFTPWLHFGWSRLQGVRKEGWKYIQAPKPELYNTVLDQKEVENQISRNQTKALQLKSWLDKSGALQIEKRTDTQEEIDPEVLEKLASLGYAGVPSKQGDPISKNLSDPKDKLNDFKLFNRLIREGIEDFQKEHFEQAAAKFRILKDKNIPSFEVHYYLGRSLLRLKSFALARGELEAAVQKLPHFLPAYADLAEVHEGEGNLKSAEQALLAGLKMSPYHPSLVQPLAWLYQEQKRLHEAETLLEKELEQYPDDIEARFRLGALYRDAGRADEAIAQFRKILQTHPEDAEAHNQLGMLYGGAARMTEAVQEFTIAARLQPNNSDIQHNLQLAKSKTEPATPKRIRFRLIQASSRAAADLILRKIQAGEDWQKLAQDYSIHPSARSSEEILSLKPEEIDPALLKALAQLKTGEISSTIQTNKGFFLVKRE
jgi:choline-sulfatase